jgi:hypothetical protein
MHQACLDFKFVFTIALVNKQSIEKQFWRFLVIRPNLEVRPYLPSTKILCRMFTGGDTSACKKYSRADHTKWYGCTYDFSQIHQDNHYKHTGAQLITEMKTDQPRSQNLAWGRPHFQSRKVCPSELLFSTSCLSLFNKIKMFASTMCLKSCLYPHFGNDEWLPC